MSWSTTLFLTVNKLQGLRPWLDVVMIFFARTLIYILAFFSFIWAVTILFDQSPQLFLRYIKLLMTGVLFGFLVSWITAIIWRNPRPIRELPDIRQLIDPFETWKAFPSDHTMVSFIIVGVTGLLGAPFWFVSVLGGMSLLVGISRVYVGVHYPRDIVGGVLFGILTTLIAPWFLQHVTQPLYDVVEKLFL